MHEQWERPPFERCFCQIGGGATSDEKSIASNHRVDDNWWPTMFIGVCEVEQLSMECSSTMLTILCLAASGESLQPSAIGVSRRNE